MPPLSIAFGFIIFTKKIILAKIDVMLFVVLTSILYLTKYLCQYESERNH